MKEKNSKRCSLFAFTAEQGWISAQKMANVVKKFLSLISNNPGFKTFILNQVICEVHC